MTVFSARREDGIVIEVYSNGDGGDGYYSRNWWEVQVTSCDGLQDRTFISFTKEEALYLAEDIFNFHVATGLDASECSLG